MIATLPAEQAHAAGFYPTPRNVAERLLAGIRWETVESVLEPSAGKGDLAKAALESIEENCPHACAFRTRSWDSSSGRIYKYDYAKAPIDCIEIDANLRHILSGEGFRVVHDDFLTFRTFKRYGLIVMNPPFDKGDQHLAHALDIQRRHGGEVRCVLNAETLRDPFTYGRRKLVKTLEELGAEIEYTEGAFRNAERQTGVAVALVRVTVPAEKRSSIILDALRKETEEATETSHPQDAARSMEKGDFLQAIVDRYRFEVSAGVRLIEEYEEMKPYIMDRPEAVDGAEPILQLVVGREYANDRKRADVNEYVRRLRLKYWQALFTDPRFTDNLTSNLVEDLRGRVDELREYDFSPYNIKELQAQLSRKLVKGVEDTIMKLFDDWTRTYSWSEYAGNRLHFDGWKTNDAFMVNRKVIHPLYLSVWSWDRYMPTDYKAVSVLSDIEKVFRYLDTRETEQVNLREALRAAQEAEQTRRIRLTYFDVTFYKKGTMHITFHDAEILHKFNLYGCRRRGWLPPTYGKRKYADMTPEEREVVDSFEGRASYEKVLRDPDFYLVSAHGQGLMLEGGKGTK